MTTLTFRLSLLILVFLQVESFSQSKNQKTPNILFCIADDASFQHMSAYGFGNTKWVNTPGFDRVAKEGTLFKRAYTPNAKCAPSRASILTGRNPWQLEEAGNHNPNFPAKFITVAESLKQSGYATGFTGKGWGPGNPGTVNGKERELIGKEYSQIKGKVATKAISDIDYAANFEAFLNEKPADKPFFFWYGSKEPHREYEYGSGAAKGKKSITDIESVPPFWIDNEVVRNDMLDYALEVEHFDSHISKILDVLQKRGELDNTLIVVTSDNGMPFPRIKGHMYDYDNHLPLAIMWRDGISKPGRSVEQFVNFIDFAPTFLEIAGIDNKSEMQPIQGKSLLPLLKLKEENAQIRDHVLLGRERTDVGRPNDVGYPVRAIVKGNYFYAINYEPERWPSGNPETGYLDTDGSPTKTVLLEANRRGDHHDLWQLSFGKKPSEELYHTKNDPYSLTNLAPDPKYAAIKLQLRKQLEQELKNQKDPRVLGNGSIFDKYPYSEARVRNFYERFMGGEAIATPWVEKTDFEKPGFKPAKQ